MIFNHGSHGLRDFNHETRQRLGGRGRRAASSSTASTLESRRFLRATTDQCLPLFTPLVASLSTCLNLAPPPRPPFAECPICQRRGDFGIILVVRGRTSRRRTVDADGCSLTSAATRLQTALRRHRLETEILKNQDLRSDHRSRFFRIRRRAKPLIRGRTLGRWKKDSRRRIRRPRDIRNLAYLAFCENRQFSNESWICEMRHVVSRGMSSIPCFLQGAWRCLTKDIDVKARRFFSAPGGRALVMAGAERMRGEHGCQEIPDDSGVC